MAKIIKPSNIQAATIRENIRLETEWRRRKARKQADANWRRTHAAQTWSALADLGG